MLTSIIVEDQARHRNTLQRMLAQYCPDVQVVATACTVSEGMDIIRKYVPSVAFLDVELADGDCFELLDSLDAQCFAPVFTTAHERYALKALKKSAVDYLLKPIAIGDLKAAVARVAQKLGSPIHNGADSPHGPQDLGKLSVPSATGFTLLSMNNILRMEAQGNYTDIFVVQGSHITASKSLGEFARQVGNSFLRIHDRHLVNLHHIRTYVNGKGGYVVLSDGSSIAVSVRKREALLRWLRVEAV